MKKKLLAMLLSATMILGIAACGSEPAGTTTESKPAAATTESTPAKEESKVEVKEDPKELTFIMYGDMGTRREDFFTGEFHDKVLEELNIDLTVEFLTWGALTGDVQNRLMAGEKFAYMHNPSQTDQAQRGLCAEITQEQIDTYLPDHTAMRGTKGYDCVKVDGKIVAIPIGNKSNSANNACLTVRNDILKEMGWDYTQITSYDKLMEVCALAKEKYPDMRIMSTTGSLLSACTSEMAGRPTFGSGNKSYVLSYLDEDNSNIYSFIESEEFKNYCKIAEEWVKLGYIKEDVISDPSAYKNDWNTGNCLLYSGVPGNMIESGVKAKMPETADLQIILLDDYDRYYNLDYDWAVSVSVAAQDDVPDYLRLFNWIYESKENYEFCIYGVEGTDWTRNADGTINRIADTLMFDDWFLQAYCYHTYDPSISKETIETYEHWDDGSKKSKMAGFTFDSTPVATEKATLDAVYSEFVAPMRSGLANYEENYESVLKKLKDAGLDKYVAEYQKQYAAWYDANIK